MALQELFYAVHEEHAAIPSKDEWYTALATAREDAITDAENSGSTVVVTEIITRPLLKTVASISLEKM